MNNYRSIKLKSLRLKNDHHSLNPASISGLCSLLTLSPDDVKGVVIPGIRALLGSDGTGIVVQSQVKKERCAIFTTLRNLLVRNGPGLLASLGGTEFVLAFMQATDGEKDPTNLVMIFEVRKRSISRMCKYF